jgi:hypothetical protein
MEGNEFEVEWYEEAIPAGASVFLRATMPSDKFLLLNYREVRASGERGFYRLYKIFSEGAVSRTLPIVNLRNDSIFSSGAAFEVVTTPTYNVGDAFSSTPLWGDSGRGNEVTQGGSLSKPESIRVFEPDSLILIHYQNTSAGACDFFSAFKFWTLSPGAVPPLEEV